MNRIRLTCVALAGLLAAALSSISACAADDEWVSLFDGQTLSGWTKAGNEDSNWEVKDGSIVGTGKSSMLYSPKTYKNFKYRAELKINDHGNSGMYFRCPDSQRQLRRRL